MVRQAIVCLINERRDHAGLGAFSENGNLDASAQGHAVAMAKHNRYYHGNAARRIRRTGYLAGATSWTIGENLASVLRAADPPEAQVDLGTRN